MPPGRGSAFGDLRVRRPEVDLMFRYHRVDVSIRDGGRQVEQADQDPRVQRAYVDEQAKPGLASRMDELLVGAPR